MLIRPAKRVASSRSQLLVVLVSLSVLASACSSGDDEPRLTPSTAVDDAAAQISPPRSNARQAGEPAPGRTAGEPDASVAGAPPLVHVLGSIRSIEDPAVSFGVDLNPILGDLATVASVGCAPASCSATGVAAWAEGEIEILNVATSVAASEGSDVLGAYVSEVRLQGVSIVGFGQDVEEAVSPVIFSSGDQAIAIHAISFDVAGDSPGAAGEDSPGIAGVSAIDLLRESIISNRNDGRGVVVVIDWGDVQSRAPTPEQLEDIDQIVNAGADAIVGHGSDFLQRFDLVGQTAVAYSLGNASVTTPDPLRADTAVMRLEFDTPGRSCLLPATAGPSGPSLDNPQVSTCG